MDTNKMEGMWVGGTYHKSYWLDKKSVAGKWIQEFFWQVKAHGVSFAAIVKQFHLELAGYWVFLSSKIKFHSVWLDPCYQHTHICAVKKVQSPIHKLYSLRYIHCVILEVRWCRVNEFVPEEPRPQEQPLGTQPKEPGHQGTMPLRTWPLGTTALDAWKPFDL